MKSFTLSVSRPDNIAVVKRGKNVRLEIEKERLREKPRKATKEIEATVYSTGNSKPSTDVGALYEQQTHEPYACTGRSRGISKQGETEQ